MLKPLEIILKKSFKNSQLPSIWKQGNVNAIFKSRSKTKPENYRPISLTSVPGKLLERLIRDIRGVIRKFAEKCYYITLLPVADPGPLMLGVLGRRTLVVNILIHALLLLVKIRTVPPKTRGSMSIHRSPEQLA